MENKKKRGRKSSPDSKRSKGGDRHTKPRKSFHADQILFDAMEEYRQATRPRPTETETLITALEEFLERRNFWPPKDKLLKAVAP